MAEKELGILVKLRDQASTQLKQLNSNIKTATTDWKRDFGEVAREARNMGIAIAAVGAAIVGALGYATKAALDERLGIIQLSTAMSNVGLSYQMASPHLEKWISSMQRATGVGDDELRPLLAQLIPMTNDLSEAQKLLVLTLDMAAETGKNTTTIINALGMAMKGTWGTLESFLPTLAGITDEQDKWNYLLKTFADQAANTADPLDVLRASIDDVSDAIGKTLLPTLIEIVDKIIPVVEGVQRWIEENPELAKWLIYIVGILGTLILVLGSLLGFFGWAAIGFMILKATVVGFAGAIVGALPIIGLIIIALVALGIAIGGIIDNWDALIGTLKSVRYEWDGLLKSPIKFTPTLASASNVSLTPHAQSITNNITVQGSVISERELGDMVRSQGLWTKDRNYNAGLE